MQTLNPKTANWSTRLSLKTVEIQRPASRAQNAMADQRRSTALRKALHTDMRKWVGWELWHNDSTTKDLSAYNGLNWICLKAWAIWHWRFSECIWKDKTCIIHISQRLAHSHGSRANRIRGFECTLVVIASAFSKPSLGWLGIKAVPPSHYNTPNRRQCFGDTPRTSGLRVF